MSRPSLDLEYFRRGRSIGVTTHGPLRGVVPLAHLFRTLAITRAEGLAALDEAEAPAALERIDGPNAEHDAIRLAGIPEDLSGKRVLDIGGYNGEWAPLCFERGADAYTVFDSGEWTDYGWAKPLLPERVVFERGNLMDFGWRAPEPADVVLFYNVLYHLRDPWSALERVRLLTRERLALCTSFVPGDGTDWRLFAHDDPGERAINDSYTVFWRPTIPGLLKLLRLTGFRSIAVAGVSGDHVVVTAA